MCDTIVMMDNIEFTPIRKYEGEDIQRCNYLKYLEYLNSDLPFSEYVFEMVVTCPGCHEMFVVPMPCTPSDFSHLIKNGLRR